MAMSTRLRPTKSQMRKRQQTMPFNLSLYMILGEDIMSKKKKKKQIKIIPARYP